MILRRQTVDEPRLSSRFQPAWAKQVSFAIVTSVAHGCGRPLLYIFIAIFEGVDVYELETAEGGVSSNAIGLVGITCRDY